MKRARIFLWIIAGPLAVFAAVLAVAFPHLAVTQKSGGDVLVIEGWMDRPQMEEAAHLALSGGYKHVYTTGTIRPFAYYLRVGEGIDVSLRTPMKGTIAVDASGVGGAGFLLISGADTLMRQVVTGVATIYGTRVEKPIEHLRLVATNSNEVDPRTDEFFVKLLSIAGEDAHLIQRRTAFVHPDGSMEYAWPTFAHRAKALLIELGVPVQRITAVPSWGIPDSRSWANASAFGSRARADGVNAFDVATLGVHARRSRALFQQACGPEVNVGVISIPDPYCAPGRWWKHSIGWLRMLKEIGGVPEARAVDITR